MGIERQSTIMDIRLFTLQSFTCILTHIFCRIKTKEFEGRYKFLDLCHLLYVSPGKNLRRQPQHIPAQVWRVSSGYKHFELILLLF